MSSILTAEDFGKARYGIHLYEHEDGWTAYGHHEPRRLIAAISHLSRENGVADVVRESIAETTLAEHIREMWGQHSGIVRGEFFLGVCETPEAWAVPITVVTL